MQEPLVLFILSIDVHNKKISIPRPRPDVPPTASAFACRLGFCDSPSWERGRPARIRNLPTLPPPPLDPGVNHKHLFTP